MSTSTFHEFLSGAATTSNGSNSQEMFNGADQLSSSQVSGMYNLSQSSKSETSYDISETPVDSANVSIKNCQKTNHCEHVGDTIQHSSLQCGHENISDIWNEHWVKEDNGFPNTLKNDKGKVLQWELPERRIPCIEQGDNERFPVASYPELQGAFKNHETHRFQADLVPQRQTQSNLKEETRRIVQMLSNDRAYKIDRPSLGLKDRLQSLVQRSAGKRTSYVKGPRVCSSLVKMLVKRTQDSMCLRRNSFQGYCKEQEGRPPLPTFNTPIQSYIKPPKHNKTHGWDNSLKGSQVNNITEFQIVKRRKKTNNDVQDSEADGKTQGSVSNSIIATNHFNTNSTFLSSTTSVPHDTTTTTTTSPHAPTVQHTPHSHQETHFEEETTDDNHWEGDNIDVVKATDMMQEHYNGFCQSVIDVELKIKVPYQSEDNDTQEVDQRQTYPETHVRNYQYDITDDKDDYSDDATSQTMEVAVEEYISDDEHHEMKRQNTDISNTSRDQKLKNKTSNNISNGLTEQIHIFDPTNRNKISTPVHKGDNTDTEKHIISPNKVFLASVIKSKQISNETKTTTEGRTLPTSQQHSSPAATKRLGNDTNHDAGVTGRGNGVQTRSSSSVESRYCIATAMENMSFPLHKSGDAMLRHIPESAIHIDTLMRLKTDNLVARHGGKKTHIPPCSVSPCHTTPAQANPPDDTFNEDDTTSNDRNEVETGLPPIHPNSHTVKKQRSLSRNESLEQPCLCSRRCSHQGQCSRRGSRMPSFSQDALRKCLQAAVDQCYNTEWEETCEKEEVKDNTLSQEELDKSMVKAVSRHDAEKVRALLKQGANPNVKCGNTPVLLRAAREGALYVMQALLAAGADTDVRTDMGNSPLHLAARGGYSEVVVQLVHSGAFVDAINRSGVTPLQMALAYGHLEVAHSLLRLDADMFLQNKVGESAAEMAKELGYTGLSGTPHEIRRDSGVGTKVELSSTDIPVAVQMIQGIEIGCAGTVDDCLREGASPNTLLPLALHWPARASVLHRAAHHGHDLIVRVLLSAGATINMTDVVGNTPLHVAAQAGHNRVVKLLLEYGAAREAISQSGMTPLHRAASKGKELTCNLLTRRGCNRQAEDSSGRTPADWARKRDFKHLSQKLMYRRKSSSTLLSDDDEKQCLEHLHQLHEDAIKSANQPLETMTCEE